tara:strand:- start:303 stop:518 length:216 start_codon:yes stop_codon:yes gene_type:complete
MDSDPTRSLADRLEIGDLITRYATAVDRRDWDLYRSVFTTDAEIDYTSAGGMPEPSTRSWRSWTKCSPDSR